MKKTLSKKLIIVFFVTALALLIQIAGLGKPHLSPFPPRVECGMILSQTSLDDGSSLVVDSQGKRLLFTNQEGQLIRVVELNASKDAISNVAETSSSAQGSSYLVHGMMRINGGNYISSESILEYDSYGNLLEESFHQDFPDNEYVSMVEFLYQKPDVNVLFNTQEESFYIDYSPAFFFECLVFWLSLVWLLGATIALGVWIAKNKDRGKIRVVLVTLLCVCITICYYTANNFQQVKTSFEQNVTTVSTQVENVLSSSESMQELQKMSDVGLNVYLTDPSNQEIAARFSESLCQLGMAYGKDQSLFIMTTSVSKDNVPYILSYTESSNVVGKEFSTVANQREQLLERLGEPTQISTPCVDAVASARPIVTEDGRVIAVVFVGSNTDNVLTSQITKSFNLFINLLALLIGVYAAISAIGMIRKAVVTTVRQKSSDVSDRIVNLSGVYMMIYKFAYNVDKVFVVYIAASLCQGMDLATQAFFVAIPVSLFYAGQWIGTFFATPLLRVFGERRLALVTCVISALIMIFTGWSIVVGNIIFYSIGRGLMGVAISGVLYVISDTLPLYAKTKEQKRGAIESSMQGSTAATILITLIGGYVSQYAGYSIIYVIGAAMCAILFAMTIITLGKKVQDAPQAETEDKQKTSYWKLWSVFLKPEFLIYIFFFSVPNLLAAGYYSYIFPLIASESGVSEVLLANISVFSVGAMHMAHGPIKKFSRQYNSSIMLVVPSLVICAGYLCFFVSPTIYWAIAMVFVVSVFNYMTNSSQKTYQMETSEKYGQDPALVQSNYYTIYSAVQTVRSPVLSAFMSLGVYVGSVVLGGVCGALFCVFGLYTKITGKQQDVAVTTAATSQDVVATSQPVVQGVVQPAAQGVVQDVVQPAKASEDAPR